MAKDSKENKGNNEYRISAKQLFEERSSRNIITGCLSLDIGLSGGIPMGCTVLLGGRSGCGKTTIALQYAANAQNKYGAKVFYFNIEGRLDHKVLRQIRNIKLEKEFFEVFMGTPIHSKEGVIIGYKKMPAEYWWDLIAKIVANNPGCIIIVDSISALSDEKELSEGMGYQSRGGLQKLESQFCRVCGDLIVPNGITAFFLAHIQANTSGYGEAIQLKCGNSIRHLADAIIFCKGVERWETSESEPNPAGQNVKCRMDKSPLGQPYMEVTVPLRFGYGLDDIQDIMTQAINWGMIKAAGSWYTLPFIEEDGKHKYTEITDALSKDIKLIKVQGEKHIRSFFAKNTEAFDVIESMIRKQVLP